MPSPETFRCGHPATPDNTSGVLRPRCRKCRNAKDNRARKRRLAQGTSLSSDAHYSRKKLPPLAAEKAERARRAEMDRGNQAFLRSMWKHHQRIMLVHQACNRQVARP